MDRAGDPSVPSKGPCLELRNVSKSFGQGQLAVTALTRISLAVAAGEFVAVMGPSGSGKTTLLSIAGGLDRPTEGVVAVEGTDLSTLARRELARMRRRSIGYVFQQLNLIQGLTAIENVSLPLELDGMDRREADAMSASMLELVSIAHLADRFPDELSGGEQQRVAIARAVVGTRRLLLADEPTGSLDSATGEAVVHLVRQLCSKGAAGVMVTHDTRFARFADRILLLRDGYIMEDSPADSVTLLQNGLGG